MSNRRIFIATVVSTALLVTPVQSFAAPRAGDRAHLTPPAAAGADAKRCLRLARLVRSGQRTRCAHAGRLPRSGHAPAPRSSTSRKLRNVYPQAGGVQVITGNPWITGCSDAGGETVYWIYYGAVYANSWNRCAERYIYPDWADIGRAPAGYEYTNTGPYFASGN